MRGTLAGSFITRAEERPGILVGAVGDVLTLPTLLSLAAGRARVLMDEGIRPDDRLAMVDSSSTDYLITWLACQLLGAPVALVNPTYPDDLLEAMLAPLSPKRVLRADDIAQARAAGVDDVSGLPGLNRDTRDAVSFMHTSGTTGLPKFCVQTHDYFQRMAQAMAGALDLRADDRVLAPLPLFHINPMGYGIITALLTGADALTVGKFSASGFWPTVLDERITVLVLHAPPVEILKRATTSDQAAGHRVRTMFYADRGFLEQFGVPAAVSGYGSTEAGGVSHLRRWQVGDAIPDNASRYGGPGRQDMQWRLDDAGIIHVRDREEGALFGGYVRAEGIDPARDADGWFDTGDLGRLSDLPGGAEPELVFLERAAESIRVKGEFVPIPFVEDAVSQVPGIEDLALWKRPGEMVDDDVVLYLVAEEVPAQALKDAASALPGFMRPVVAARVAAIPRDAAAGKVQRRRLSETPVLEWVDLT